MDDQCRAVVDQALRSQHGPDPRANDPPMAATAAASVGTSTTPGSQASGQDEPRAWATTATVPAVAGTRRWAIAERRRRPVQPEGSQRRRCGAAPWSHGRQPTHRASPAPTT